METVTSKINVGEKPDGHEGPGFFATRLDKVVVLREKTHLAFAIRNFMLRHWVHGHDGAHYDLARFVQSGWVFLHDKQIY